MNTFKNTESAEQEINEQPKGNKAFHWACVIIVMLVIGYCFGSLIVDRL